MSTVSPDPNLLPTWISAIATALAVVVGVVAVILTYRQIRLAAGDVRRASAREALDSEERTRPYIGVDLVPGLQGPPVVDITIENFGRTTARAVRLTLDGAEFEKQSEADEIGPALGRYFAEGFDLAPGARRRFMWRLAAEKNSSPSGDMGAPLAGDILITYGWEDPQTGAVKPYDDHFRYDMTEYLKLTPMPSTGLTSSGSGDDILSKNAVNALRSIAHHIAESRR